MTEQTYAQALLLAGDLSEHQQLILQALCTAKVTMLTARLRRGLTPEDCKADFIASASLLALADLDSLGGSETIEQISAGDFTIRKTKQDAAVNCLRAQAELMIAPYLKDRFSFRGV